MWSIREWEKTLHLYASVCYHDTVIRGKTYSGIEIQLLLETFHEWLIVKDGRTLYCSWNWEKSLLDLMDHIMQQTVSWLIPITTIDFDGALHSVRCSLKGWLPVSGF